MADRTRRTADLVSDKNLYVDISTDRVGVGTTSPTQKLEVDGSLKVNNDVIIKTQNITTETHKLNTFFNLKTVTNNYTLSRDDGIILVNGIVTINLPTTIGFSGDKYIIKNVGVGTVTILPFGSETINGYSNMIMQQKNSSLGVLADGVNGWHIF